MGIRTYHTGSMAAVWGAMEYSLRSHSTVLGATIGSKSTGISFILYCDCVIRGLVAVQKCAFIQTTCVGISRRRVLIQSTCVGISRRCVFI
jgi:hypothetical protein